MQGTGFAPRAFPIPSASNSTPIHSDEQPTHGDSPIADGVNPFYAAGALGLATLLVTLSASAGVWGVKTYLGVNNVRLPRFSRFIY